MKLPCADFVIGLDDPSAQLPFLSHAHSDHARGFKKVREVIASKETVELASLSAHITLPKEVTLYDAGHILGAKQIAFECDGERVLYTGDFSLKENIFGFKADIPECDYLIFDATYGSPTFSFPSPFDVYEEIEKWVKQNIDANIIIGCYELGKAQELMKLLNEIGVSPFITKKCAHYSSLYARYFKLEWEVLDENAEISPPFVALLPMRFANKRVASRLSYAYGRKTLCAVATGWALTRKFYADKSFLLTNHCDYNDLCYFIERTGAKKLKYFCGNGEALINAFLLKNYASQR